MMIYPKVDEDTIIPTVGLFGKVPGCAEFIRHNMSGEGGRKIFQWLGTIWDQGRERPIFFSLHSGGSTVVYGHCQASLDKLGRVAPLVQFVEAQSGCPFGLLRLLKPYIGIEYERPEIRARWACYTRSAWMMRLNRFDADERTQLGSLTIRELIEEIKMPMCKSMRDYAFATLWQASARAVGHSAIPFRLELPVHSDRTRSFWLYFLHHLLDLSPISTKLIWWHEEGENLVLQSGVRAPQRHIWRLTTSGDEARVRVSKLLPSSWRCLLDREHESVQQLADCMIEAFKKTRERVVYE